jgi:ATP-dependent helicase HrpA
LLELGAIEDAGDGRRRLTPSAGTMARLPVDVKLARMLVAAQRSTAALRERCCRSPPSWACRIRANDPPEATRGRRQCACAVRRSAFGIRRHRAVVAGLRDRACEELTQSKLRDWCGKRFLGFLRMREWRELHRQLQAAVRRTGLEPERRECRLRRAAPAP